MPRPKNPPAAADKVHAALERLYADAAPLLDGHLDDLLGRMHSHALDGLRADLAGGGSSVRHEETLDSEQEAKPARAARTIVHRDAKPEKSPPAAKVAGKVSCSKCGEPGHNTRSCGRAPKGPGGVPVERSAVETSAKARRADIIAKRAGVLPASTSTFELGGDED